MAFLRVAQQTRLGGMPEFYVFWDRMMRRVKIHRRECRSCKDRNIIRQGRGKDYDWVPAKTYEEARSVAERFRRHGMQIKGSHLNCGLRHPEK